MMLHDLIISHLRFNTVLFGPIIATDVRGGKQTPNPRSFNALATLLLPDFNQGKVDARGRPYPAPLLLVKGLGSLSGYGIDGWWSDDPESPCAGGRRKVGWVVIGETAKKKYRHGEIQPRDLAGNRHGDVRLHAPRNFDPELPQSILAHKPLFMLIQVQDEHHVRIGFKANKTDRWRFSKAFGSRDAFGKIAKFAYPCLVSFQGGWVGNRAWGGGNHPGYQKFLIDYIYYRYELSP